MADDSWKNKMKLATSYLNKNIFIFIFFLFYLLIGLLIYKDYSISFDEEVHRENGFISLKYILDFFLINFDFSNITTLISGEIPDIQNDWRQTYGVAFDLPMAIIEILLGFNDTRDVYLFRHLMTFLIFFSSTICFFYLLNLNFSNKILCILGVLMLILSPRIFSQSFYNSRDITFLSFIIFSTFFSLKALNTNKIKYIILAAFFAALSTNTRVLGCYIPFLTIFFYFLNYKGRNIVTETLKFCFLYFLFFLTFLYLSWPYLWESPFLNFFKALIEFSRYPFNPYILYLGDYIKANFIPWHYFFIWFSITTPIIFLILILIGLYLLLKKFLNNLFKIEQNNSYLLWKSSLDMNELYIFFVFFIPLFFVVFLNSTLYTGWRHLYFIYPPLIFLGISGFSQLISNKKKVLNYSIISCLIIQIFSSVFFLIKSHPVQNVYFNSLSKKIVKDSFFYDYWGLANKVTMEKLLSNKNLDFPINISASSFTDLNKTKLIMDKKDRNKFIYVGIDKKKSDYIFTNYYYITPPITDNKYLVPKNYESIIKLKIGGLVINEVFKKKQ